MSKKWIAILLMIPFLLSPPALADKGESWQDEIIYFIMIDRFHNGDQNNDYEVDVNDPKAYHGGILKGLSIT